jgi:hypothetical protein
VLSLVWNVLDVNKHTSNISAKANELTVAIVAETKASLSLGSYQTAKTLCLQSCEKPEAMVAHFLI